MTENLHKDLSQWELPVHKSESIEKVVDCGFPSDGIYQVSIGEGVILDVLVQNVCAIGRSDYVLIGLNGAVTQREKKKGPFFSGTSITKKLGVLSISISDPTLDIDGSIGLAWYAGNEQIPDLPLKLAALITGVSQKYNLRPVLFGGSGAGFAALNISPHINVPHVVIVWNPQTRILKYFARFVETYLKSAFPKLWSKMYSKGNYRDRGREAFLGDMLEESGISHSLESKQLNRSAQIIYLQNRDDWHVQVHAEPFLRELGPWRRCGPCSFQSGAMNVGAVFGNWGEGHAAPPRSTIYSLLKFCASHQELFSEESSNIFSLFLQESAYSWSLCPDELSFANKSDRDTHPQMPRLEQPTLELHVVYSKATSVVLAELCFHPKPNNEVKNAYAFYLLVNGVRIKSRWYESEPYVAFDVDPNLNPETKVEILAFVKDQFGKIRRARKSVLLV